MSAPQSLSFFSLPHPPPPLYGSIQVYQCCCSKIYFLVLTKLTCSTLAWSVVRWRSVPNDAVLASLLIWHCVRAHPHPRMAICHPKVTKKNKKTKQEGPFLYFARTSSSSWPCCVIQWRISLSLEEQVKLLLDRGFESEPWWARGRPRIAANCCHLFPSFLTHCLS